MFASKKMHQNCTMAQIARRAKPLTRVSHLLRFGNMEIEMNEHLQPFEELKQVNEEGTSIGQQESLQNC